MLDNLYNLFFFYINCLYNILILFECIVAVLPARSIRIIIISYTINIVYLYYYVYYKQFMSKYLLFSFYHTVMQFYIDINFTNCFFSPNNS